MIREATSADSLNLAALTIQVWLHTFATEGIRDKISKHVLSTYTEQHFNELLDDPKYCVLVFEEESHLRAFAVVDLESVFEDESNGFKVDRLYVQEHFQGRGIGKSLLNEIQSRFGDRFWLNVWVHNENALGFYKNHGFRDIGRTDFDLDGELHENRVLTFDGT